MKRLLNYLMLVALLLIPKYIFATGYISASPSSITVEVGSSATFTITAQNAVGDVSISSSNSGVAQINKSFFETGAIGGGATVNGVVTVTGVSEGSTTIVLSIDGATFDSERIKGTQSINVNVVPKATPTPTPTPVPTPAPTPTPTPDPSNDNKNKKEETKKEDDQKSHNANIKDISVEGQKLDKIDNNNYSLTVSSDVTSVNIKAIAEDSKAKVTGDGKHELNIGDNTIELVITSEAGEQNKIVIKVTRKDAYYLDDLDTVLNDNSITDISIKINSDTVISKEDIEKIKNSKKAVKFYRYNDDKVLYDFIIYGSKIDDLNDFNTTLLFESDNVEDISKLSNYADGMYVNIKGDYIPKGARLKVYVGNKYKDKDYLNVYYYDKTNNKLISISKDLKIIDGYIEFDVEKTGDYFITRSLINSGTKSVNSSNNIYVIFIIIALISLLVSMFILYIILKRKNKNE